MVNLIANLQSKQISLNEGDASEIVFGIAKGLKFLHSNGIIHRDLKLGRIFFGFAYINRAYHVGLNHQF